ncbi:MAG: DUF4430 domain-containing protein [Oscillospiraceae bacterium]|nr:DUF4430 domain-containing protein [Oscillospiraceae bacterium]
MGRIKRLVAITLAAMTLFCVVAQSVLADEADMITVSLRVEGIKENMYYKEGIRIAAGSTVEALLKHASDADSALTVKITNSEHGAYISEINGLAEFALGEMSGWNYRVNDTAPAYGISQYELESWDTVVCYFGDPYGAGMQYPQADWSRILSEGIIKFSSIDAEYDEFWALSLNDNPVVGAKVTFRWDSYVTDINGEITINDKTGLSGYRPLQIERYDEATGAPTALRFAPGFEIYVPFADTPHETWQAWYEDAVRFCVRKEYFVGTNLAANLFEPSRNMTMAQLVTVLARIGNVDTDLTTGDLWYDAPLDWAVNNGILSGVSDAVINEGIGALYELTSGMNVTREEFIHMFYLTVRLVGSADMNVRADISTASDYGDITKDYLESISWAVASGIIKGTAPGSLIISPKLEVNRATVCQMIHNYYTTTVTTAN